MQNKVSPGSSSQKGFTLIEVLVTVIVLAVGLLGLAGLQASSLRFNHGAYLNSQATNLAYEIIDRMRANNANAVTGAYDIALAAAPGGAGVVNQDLTEWKASLSGLLPLGDGAICRSNAAAPTSLADCTASGTMFIVVVQWNDDRNQQDTQGQLGVATPEQLIITAEL